MSDFAMRIRRLREERKLTQTAVAMQVGVERPTLSQWEAGRYLPSRSKAEALDAVYGTGDLLVRLADAERSGAIPLPVSPPVPLAAVFAAAGERLAHAWVRDPDNPACVGWTHNIGRGRRPTPWSTAFALRTLLLLDRVDVDLGRFATTVANRQAGGGWSNRELREPRPEVTATVLDALARVGAHGADLEAAWRWLENSIRGTELGRPYVLSVVLDVTARFRPDSPFVGKLVRHLLAARKDFDGTPLWAAEAAVDARRLEPSLAHTARAAAALRAAAEVIDDPALDDAVDTAVRWMAGWDRQDDGVTEVLRIADDPDSRALDVPISHFTAAWVVQALLGADGVPARRLDAALSSLWAAFEPNEGVWIWRLDGRLPVWMTHDAVRALRSVALAENTTPITSLPERRLDPNIGTGA